MMDNELVRSTVRSILVAAGSESDASDQLLESGWWELLQDEPDAAVMAAFYEQGRTLRRTRALDLLILSNAGQPGDSVTAVIHSDTLDPPGRMVGDSVTLDGFLLGEFQGGSEFAVPTEDALIFIDPGHVETTAVKGMDQNLNLRRVAGRSPVLRKQNITWSRIILNAHRALSYELLGVAEELLDRTLTHIRDRTQFGRPIASFQTVQHRMAEIRVAVEAARSVVELSWTWPTVEGCRSAKALAGRAALLAVEHCQQVTGATGFIMENYLPAFARRIAAVNGLYGSHTQLEYATGTVMIQSAQVCRYPSPW